MNLKKLTMVPMLAMALFAVGCGADCEGQCEDLNECEGTTEKLDCEKSCADGDKLAEDKGCEDQRDDVLSCFDDVDDICKTDEKTCASELKAWNDCIQ